MDALDAAAVREWSRCAIEALLAHQREIDALNVFPVPDGDTGTNLLRTLQAGDRTLAAAESPDAGHALRALAAGAAREAVGNSGFIVSQLLRGLADAGAADPSGAYDGAVVAAGLDRGALLCRDAVVTPVEGTILTVARAAADAAGVASASGADLGQVVLVAAAAADTALQLTTGQLAELAAADVVDAGGRGLVLVLDALAFVVTGAGVELTAVRSPEPAGECDSAGPLHAADQSDGHGYGFEVQYLLDASPAAVQTLRGALARLGDSVVVVPAGGGEDLDRDAGTGWHVHVHVDDVGAAIEAGVDAGRPHRIRVVRLDEHSGRDEVSGRSAVLAVAPGAGLAHLFESEGVRVVEGGAGARPSTDDVVAAIDAAGVRQLVLLPNASQVTGVAEAAAARVRGHGVRVSVVPTRSPVQGLAAIAVHDPARPFDDDVIAMAEAAAATRFAEITIARDRALTAVGICEAGDVLGLIDGEVVEIGRGVLAVAFALVDRLLGVGAELLTVLLGAGAAHRTGEVLTQHVRERAPLTDVVVYEGGQPELPVIIGVE